MMISFILFPVATQCASIAGFSTCRAFGHAAQSSSLPETVSARLRREFRRAAQQVLNMTDSESSKNSKDAIQHDQRCGVDQKTQACICCGGIFFLTAFQI